MTAEEIYSMNPSGSAEKLSDEQRATLRQALEEVRMSRADVDRAMQLETLRTRLDRVAQMIVEMQV